MVDNPVWAICERMAEVHISSAASIRPRTWLRRRRRSVVAGLQGLEDAENFLLLAEFHPFVVICNWPRW